MVASIIANTASTNRARGPATSKSRRLTGNFRQTRAFGKRERLIMQRALLRHLALTTTALSAAAYAVLLIRL